MDFAFLRKQTSPEMVGQIETLMAELEETTIDKLNIQHQGEWVIVTFILAGFAFFYQFNSDTNQFDSWHMPVEALEIFRKMGDYE